MEISIQKNVLQYIFDNEIPNSWVTLRILLIIPGTVASVERCFSKLKLIKTYLRSNMANGRLVSLFFLSIEYKVVETVYLTTTVIKSFTQWQSGEIKNYFNYV